MFDWTIDMAEKVTTVPYSPLTDDIRKNQGFVDVRGRPDLAETIMEAQKSPAMRKLLVRLAQPGSRIFSVGCDVGKKRVKEKQLYYYTAGGYIQVMSKNYAKQQPTNYSQYGEAVANLLKQKSFRHEWRLNLSVAPMKFNLDGFRDMTGSLSAWFHAFADTERLAIQSRETCISRLADCLFNSVNLAYLD